MLEANKESEDHIFGENQSKCCTISSHIKGVNQDSREGDDHTVTLSTTKKYKLLRSKADKMVKQSECSWNTQMQKERKFGQ